VCLDELLARSDIGTHECGEDGISRFGIFEHHALHDIDTGDLRVSVTDSDDTVEPGDTFTYTIRLENTGNDDIRV
jgi:hypothetical protein